MAAWSRRTRADRVVSQVRPVMMLIRWSRPATGTRPGDWPKPAPDSTAVVSMVKAVTAL